LALRGRNPEEAIAAIKKLGGQVEANGKGSVVEVNLGQAEVTDADFVHLKNLPQLRSLVLGDFEFGSQISNAGLKHLRGLPGLESLNLANTHITDAGLEHLQGLTNLEELWLRSTQVTHEGVKKLQQALPNCKISHQPFTLTCSRGERV
jgi:hypothetical protein